MIIKVAQPLPFNSDENQRIKVHEMTTEEIGEKLAKIRNQHNAYIQMYGRAPKVIVINELEFRFISEYLKHYQIGYNLNPGICHKIQLYGMKVLTMKAKGFVFADE